MTPGKRIADVVGALLLLVLTAPVLLTAMAAVAVTLGRPVCFRQTRTGLNLRRFELCKLRTMTGARDARGRLLPDGERLTRLGRLLRRASIDELPGLVNVLRGEMSLVGPRPLLPRYEPFYTERERLRFGVRPGITGLAQVSGRNAVAWDERLELDARYAEAWTPALDLRILTATAVLALTGRGAAADPAALMADLDAERAAAR